jgi:sorbose reductase
MTLSTGDETSLTGPPPPTPHYLNAEGRARLRFEVEGNAVFVLTLPNVGRSRANGFIDSVTGGTGTLGFQAARALLEHGLSGLMIWEYELSFPPDIR